MSDLDDKQGVPFGRYMTGQMFYDRFIANLKAVYKAKQGMPMNVLDLEDEVVEAAKKAAGLE